jgi:hypothetical protein
MGSRGRVLPALLGCVLLAGACGGRISTSTGNASATTAYTLDEDAVALPDPSHYGLPSLLAGDLSDSGLWYWTATSTHSYLNHVDGQSDTTSSYLVGTSAKTRVNPARGGLAVSASGDVWLGIGLSVFRLVPGSGAVQEYDVPPQDVVDNATAESYRPTELQGLHGIQAIAISPDGSKVALGIEAANDVAVLDATTGTFSTAPLPSTTDAISLAYLNPTDLAIGLENYATHDINTVIVDSVGGSYTATVPDSRALTLDNGSLISGAGIPSVVADYTTNSPVVSNLMSSASPFPVAVASAPLTADKILLAGLHTLVIESLSSRQILQELPIPAGGQCAYSIPLSETANTEKAETSEPCSSTPRFIATDALGVAWMVGMSPGYISILRAAA